MSEDNEFIEILSSLEDELERTVESILAHTGADGFDREYKNSSLTVERVNSDTKGNESTSLVKALSYESFCVLNGLIAYDGAGELGNSLELYEDYLKVFAFQTDKRAAGALTVSK